MKPDRRFAALVEAGIALSSELGLESLLQRIADLAREVIGARYAAVGVIGDDATGELSRFVHSGISKEEADRIGDLPRGRGVLGVLIEQGRPLRLAEISDHARSYGFPEHHPPMHTFLGVPIVVRGNVFGRLYVTEKEGGEAFTKDDERIAMTLASQAGVAVENARLYEELATRRLELSQRVGELASVENVAGLLIAERPADEVAQSAVREALKLTGATRALLSLLDEDTGDLVIRHEAGTQPSSVVGTRLPAETSKAHGVMRRAMGEIVPDLASDPEVHASTMRQLDWPQQGAFVPIMLRGKAIGVLAVYDGERAISFVPEDLVLLQVLSNHVGIAFENERLSLALQDLAVLEERDRIAKELHDGVIQSIYSVGLSLQGTSALLERDPDSSRKRINDVIAELDNVVRDVRSYIFELKPKTVEEHGLEGVLGALVRDFQVNTLAETTLRLDADACGKLAEDQQVHVVQIVREVLSNIARHSAASELLVDCGREGSDTVLTIEDDGKTYDPEQVARGQGLHNIEDRARRLGGELTIEPRAEGGMRHTLRIPEGTAT